MTGEQFRAHRLRLGLTLTEYSASLGISRTTAAKYEASPGPVPRTLVLAVTALAYDLAPAAASSRKRETT